MIGHWNYPFDFSIADFEGFIYRIIDKETKREYIGKKSFHSRTSKLKKGRTNRTHTISESNWKKYTSSSKIINALIKEHGIERFTFIIESLHETKASLTYAEVHQLVIEDALRAELKPGVRKYYNGMIPAIKYIPPLTTQKESSMINRIT